MKDRTRAPGLDMLSMYSQDDLHLSVFVVEQMLAELESVNHFLPVVVGRMLSYRDYLCPVVFDDGIIVELLAGVVNPE